METLTRQRQLLIRAGLLDLMLMAQKARLPMATAAAQRVRAAWDAVKLPEDAPLSFDSRPKEAPRILLPIGEGRFQ